MTNYNGQLPPDVTIKDITLNQPIGLNSNKPFENKAFDTRNYLNFSIPEGKKSVEKVIRLLPIKMVDGEPEMFQIVHMHNIPVHKDLNPNKSGKKVYMCLNAKNTGIDHEKYGTKCPICEAQQALWKEWHAETDPAKKKTILSEIKQLDVREYCIIRCIERGKEDEGPKFWRIPLRVDQTDAYHKMQLLSKTRTEEGAEAGLSINIFSIYDGGRDLIITFTEGTGAPTIVDKGISTPLTKDLNQLNEWYYHEKKWSDVFSTKPYDYLKIAFEGDVPWYDNVNKTWIRKTEFDTTKQNQEATFDDTIKKTEAQFISEVPPAPQATVSYTPIVEPQVTVSQPAPQEMVYDNDLPF